MPPDLSRRSRASVRWLTAPLTIYPGDPSTSTAIRNSSSLRCLTWPLTYALGGDRSVKETVNAGGASTASPVLASAVDTADSFAAAAMAAAPCAEFVGATLEGWSSSVDIFMLSPRSMLPSSGSLAFREARDFRDGEGDITADIGRPPMECVLEDLVKGTEVMEVPDVDAKAEADVDAIAEPDVEATDAPICIGGI